MPKTKAKPTPKAKPKPKTVTARHVSHPLRPTTKRITVHEKPHPQQKARPPMSADTTTSPPRDPRGAGSGENAVAQRSRPTKGDPAQANDIMKFVKQRQAEAVKNNQKFADETESDLEDTEDPDLPEPGPVTEYPEGDPDKGAIDPENPQRLIAHRDRRAYLVRQAERNEAANDQLNAMQVAGNRRVQAVTSALQDPDYLREVSMETAQAALHQTDPEVVKKNHDEMAKRMKARQEREAKAAK